MPSPTHSTRPTSDNAFDPQFLDQLAQHEPPSTCFEALYGGAWRVLPLSDATQDGDPRYGLFLHWKSPEHGDKPFATFTDRPAALLAAATLPLLAMTRSMWVHRDDDGDGYVLYRAGEPVARMDSTIGELNDALNLADALARTPTALARLLAAAGSDALAEAGRILVRGEPLA